MVAEPIDQDARDKATTLLGESVFIEAGAGTGKSSTLVKRIVNTVRHPDPQITIDQIAAITFTDKAGTDLRNRLRGALKERADEDEDDARVSEALENLDAATVGTIHSFAQDILREHAISAGIPLGFTIATDAVCTTARATRVRDAVQHAYAELDPETRTLLDDYEVSVETLRELIHEIDLNMLRLSSAAFEDDRSAQIEVSRQRTINLINDFWLRAQDACTDPQDKLFVIFADVLPDIARKLQSADPPEMAQMLDRVHDTSNRLMQLPGPAGAGANWPDKDAKSWRDEYKELIPAVSQFLYSAEETAIRRALRLAWDFLEQCRERRAQDGTLEFDDLLVLTRQLLADNRDVRAYLHRKFKIVMVDEFQDTDPLQWDIVRMVTADPDDLEHRPLPGRLVVVGDPKQAIYSFRGADVNTYLAARKQFEAVEKPLGEVLTLKSNFRSVRPVIDKVNTIFSDAIGSAGPPQVNYSALVAAHDPQDADAGPAYLVLRDPSPEEDDSEKYPSREMEPKRIAYAISLAITDEWKVTDPVDKHSRAYTRVANFSDVVILYPARTGRAALLDALDDFGIPYRSADAGLVYDRPAVLGLRSALTYAAEGVDDLNLWLAMKSPLFGLTDRQLLDHRLGGGRWRFSEENPAGPVSDALKVLYRLRRNAARRTPLELMDKVLRVTRIFEALPFTKRGDFEADCLRMFRAHAQQWQDEGGVGLYEYLQWVDSVMENAHRTSLPEPDDRQDNAVRLMTTFQAKGLEFPIVALAGMSHAPGSSYPALGIASPDRYELRVSEQHVSAEYTAWYEDEHQARERAEDTRLMYVACTRARDHLIISVAGERVSMKKGGEEAVASPPYATLLLPSIPTADTDITVIPDHAEPISLPVAERIAAIDDTWFAGIDDIRERSGQKWVASPTGLGALALGVPVESEVIDDQPSDPTSAPVDPRRAGRDGSAIGQTVHRALDILVHEDEPSPQRVHQVCGQMAEEEETLADLSLITAMANVALSSDTIARARSASRLWTEMYLAAPVEHEHVRVVDGLADLVFQDDDGIHIIDYKTDKSIGEHNLPKYHTQLSSYAEMMRRATGEQRITASVLHLTEDSAREISIV